MYKSVIPVDGDARDYTYNPHLSAGDNNSLNLYAHQLDARHHGNDHLRGYATHQPGHGTIERPRGDIYAQTIAPLHSDPVDPRGVTVVSTGTMDGHHGNGNIKSSTIFVAGDRAQDTLEDKDLARRFKQKYGRYENGPNLLARGGSEAGGDGGDRPWDCLELSVLACLCVWPLGLVALCCSLKSRRRYRAGRQREGRTACIIASVFVVLALLAVVGVIIGLCVYYLVVQKIRI